MCGRQLGFDKWHKYVEDHREEKSDRKCATTSPCFHSSPCYTRVGVCVYAPRLRGTPQDSRNREATESTAFLLCIHSSPCYTSACAVVVHKLHSTRQGTEKQQREHMLQLCRSSSPCYTSVVLLCPSCTVHVKAQRSNREYVCCNSAVLPLLVTPLRVMLCPSCTVHVKAQRSNREALLP